MTTMASVLLAPDPAVPLRDVLLDPQRAPVPIDASSVEIVRCKYRVGESMRVLYRCVTSDGLRLVTVRASADREPRWWTLPDDRRLPQVAALLGPAPELVALAGGRAWTRSEIAEYAPERSITVRAVASDGSGTAFAKHYAQGERDVSMLAARYTHVARACGGPSVPRPLGWSPDHAVLVLDAAPGRQWADIEPAEASSVSSSMGRAIAALHGVRAPAGTPPFERLGAGRVRRSAQVLVAARPDVASTVRDLAWRLAARRVGGPPVLVHGDCHPKNAIVDGERLTLIDLDQAGCGAAAADIGSLLARVRTGDIIATAGAAAGASVVDAFLAGYASQRPLPPDESLRWHTAAALVVEQAVRAVNRVRPQVLAELPAILAAAGELLPRAPR
jgi:aminoglycoside phosphotransferase